MALDKELDLDRPFRDLRHETILNIVRTSNLLLLEGSGLFRRYGLTQAQYNVLFALKFKRRNLTQSELGKRLVVTRASITSVLDKLESKLLVSRQRVPENRRIHHVELTDKGKQLIEQLEPLYRKAIHLALAEVSEEGLASMIKCLESVRTNALAEEVHQTVKVDMEPIS